MRSWHSYGSIEKLCYIAGFFDAEGTVGIYRTKPHRDKRYRSGFNQGSWHWTAAIVSTCYDTLCEIRDQSGFGTVSLQSAGKNKKVYVWRVQSRADVEGFLTPLVPFLREKRGQAITILRNIQGDIDTESAARFLKGAKKQ